MPTDTTTLIGVMTERKQFAPVFKSLFFPRRRFFNDKKIAIDKIVRKNTKAPFVSPLVAGQVRRREGTTELHVYPAYLKPKDALNPDELQERLPGESYDTPLSPEQRRDAIMMNLAVEQDEQIDVAEEYLCVQIVKFGKVTIESDKYPASEIDYGRKPENTIVLTGSSRWSELNKETHNLDAELTEYMSRSSKPIKLMQMNQRTYAEFVSFKSVKEKLDTRRGSSSQLETAAFNGDFYAYMGMYGHVEVWVYSGTYDEGDEEKMFLEDGEVLFSPSMAQGTMAYGMIHDKKANYQAVERFPKEFEQDDPSGEYMMTQSAPLPVPENFNDFVYLKAYSA